MSLEPARIFRAKRRPPRIPFNGVRNVKGLWDGAGWSPEKFIIFQNSNNNFEFWINVPFQLF